MADHKCDLFKVTRMDDGPARAECSCGWVHAGLADEGAEQAVNAFTEHIRGGSPPSTLVERLHDMGRGLEQVSGVMYATARTEEEGVSAELVAKAAHDLKEIAADLLSATTKETNP
jgi:hypothetical protein